MARRRQISSGISVDKTINRLAVEYGDFAVVLYTWMIPHAEEDATLTGDPEEILFSVIPGRRDKDVADVVAALSGMVELGLIEWDRDNSLIGFPVESFYRYQSNVKAERRRTCSIFDLGSETGKRETPQNTTEHHETPEITASITSSVSSSVAVADTREESRHATPPEIELSETERRVAARIRQVRGMATVPEGAIVLHLRDVLSDRASPLPDDVLLAEAMRFRDFWQDKRSNQPIDKAWPSRGWKRALTNWFTRTKHEPVAAATNGLDRYEDWTGRYAET